MTDVQTVEEALCKSCITNGQEISKGNFDVLIPFKIQTKIF